MNTQAMKRITLAIVLCATGTSAMAQERDKPGFYFGAGLSHSNLVVDQDNIAFNFGTDTQSQYEANGIGLALMAGISLDEHLSFEMSYTGIGSIALNDGLIQQKMFEADIYNFSAILSQSISDNVDLFAKLGTAYWELVDEDLNDLESGSGIVYGAGMDINVYGHNNRILRLEWQHQEFDGIIFESSDSIGVSAVFKF